MTNWKNGKNPNIEEIKKISEFFNVSTDYIIKGENPTTQTIINSQNHVSEGSSQKNFYNQGGEFEDEFEKELISEYRSLNIKNKRKLFDYIDTLKENESN